MTLRIVHWGKFYPPEWGGTEGVTHDLAVGAAEHGHDVAVVAFTRGDATSETSRGVRILRARATGQLNSQPLSLRWAYEALKQARRAQVIHVHAPNLLAAMILPAVPRRVKVVVHWHTDLVGKGLLGTLARPLEMIMAWRADRLLASSDRYAIASTILQRFKSKTVAIPLGIDDPAAGVSASVLSGAVAAFAGDRPIVLSVGRTVPYKGFEHLIRAAARMSARVAVVIVGSGPLDKAHRRLVEDLGVADRVLLAGRLSPAELNALFRAAAIYAMPSAMRSEAFGVVLLEAMAHGLPIVATDIAGSGVAWVAGDGETGLIVPPANAAALAEAIDSLIANAPARANFAAASRARYLRMFTRKRMLDAVLALYAELCGAR